MQVRRISMVAGAVLMLSLGANASAVVGGQCLSDGGSAGDAYGYFFVCAGDSPSQGVEVFQISGSSGTFDTYAYASVQQQGGYTSGYQNVDIVPGVYTSGGVTSSDSFTYVSLGAGREDANAAAVVAQYADGEGCHQYEQVFVEAAGQHVSQEPAEHGCVTVPGVPALP